MIALHALWDIPFHVTAMFHFGLIAIADQWLVRRMDPEMSPVRQITLPFVWLLRELIFIPLWIFTLTGNQVLWKGKLITLMPGGLIKNEV